MKLERTVALYTFKFFSFLCSIVLLIVLLNIIFNYSDNDNYSKNHKYNLEKFQINTLKKEKDNKLYICNNNNKSFNKILLNIIPDNNKCEKLPSIFEYLLFITENKYVYYSFALMLGGVINLKKIVKIGIF